MNERVECPVCGTERGRERFPHHFADEHPGEGLRETFSYSAVWAGIPPVLAVLLGVVQTALVVLDVPRPGPLRDAIAAEAGVYTESVPTFLALMVAPVVAVVVGALVVALARSPGQTVRRGWRPRRYEFVLVALWGVPMVGPGVYVIGAGRRFVAVRFLREKLAAAGFVATDDLADADRALAANRHADAADAFDAAGTLLQGLRDDAHMRNPDVEARLGALAHGCGTAAAICEHHAADTDGATAAPTAP